MATFLLMAKWTEQGVRDVKHTVERGRGVVREFERRGVAVVGHYWAHGGDFDVLMVVRAGDERAVAAGTLAVESLGNVRVQAVRAFDAAEMEQIVEQL